MKVSTRIGYRAKPKDERILLLLSQQLDHDSISDTLRFAVRYTARAYGLLPEKKQVMVDPLNKGEADHEPSPTAARVP